MHYVDSRGQCVLSSVVAAVSTVVYVTDFIFSFGTKEIKQIYLVMFAILYGIAHSWCVPIPILLMHK